MITNCPVCGKGFDVLWPNLWRFRRDRRYLCSWSCMRALDDQKGENRDMALSKAQKQQVIEMLLNGENPNDFIKQCGIKNPTCTVWNLKNYLKKYDPETWKKIQPKPETPETVPAPIGGGKWEKMETPEDVVIDAAKLMLPDPPKAVKPVDYGIFLMDVIRSPETGARYEFKENLLFVKYGPDEFVMEPKDWRKLIDEIPKAAAVLGVEL